jgi:hypothetical protein
MVRHQKLHHKKARSPNRNLVGVPCPTLLNMGERISVGRVVGHIRRRIVLILFKQPPPTPILSNLVPIARHIAMM